MILLQDEFAQVISRMEKKMKDVIVLSTRQGAPLTDLQQRQILANIDVNIKLCHGNSTCFNFCLVPKAIQKFKKLAFKGERKGA